MRWGMLIIGDEEGGPVLPWDPTELTGEGLGDMGDGVPVLFPLLPQEDGFWAAFDEFLKYSISALEYLTAWSLLSRNILQYRRARQR